LKEKWKKKNRFQNAQVHATIAIVGVAPKIVVVIVATTTSLSNDSPSKISMVVVSIPPLVVGQCVEVVENMGANHEHMVVIISSVVNVLIDY